MYNSIHAPFYYYVFICMRPGGPFHKTNSTNVLLNKMALPTGSLIYSHRPLPWLVVDVLLPRRPSLTRQWQGYRPTTCIFTSMCGQGGGFHRYIVSTRAHRPCKLIVNACGQHLQACTPRFSVTQANLPNWLFLAADNQSFHRWTSECLALSCKYRQTFRKNWMPGDWQREFIAHELPNI